MQRVVEIPGYGEVEFPESMSQDEVNAAAKRLYESGSGSAATPAKAPEPTWREKAMQFLPDRRTAMRVGGGILGGVAGLPLGIPGAMIGGAAGASAGESLYQIGGHLANETRTEAERVPVPRTAGEAAQAQTGAIIQGALQEGIPAYLTTKFPQTVRNAAARKVGESVRVQKVPVGSRDAVRKVAAEAVDQFPIARTEEQLFNKLKAITDSAKAAADAEYNVAAQSGALLDSAPIVIKLQDRLNRIVTPRGTLPGAEAEAGMLRKVIKWFQKSPQFDPIDFRTAKQGWDKIVNYGRSPLAQGSGKEDVIKLAADEVRASLHSMFPKVADAERAHHVWLTLKQTLAPTVSGNFGKEQLQQIIARSGVGGSIGAGAAMMTGESPYKGALIGATLGSLAKTTAWNTLSVSERAMLAKMLETQAAKTAIRAGSRAGSAALEMALTRKPSSR